MPTASYQCWVLELPEALEEELCGWLDQEGARAYVREAHPPNRFFAYFDFGHKAPDPAHLKRWVNVNLLQVDTLQDEDWLAKSRESFKPIKVGSRFYIRPSWHEDSIPDGRIPIAVNPGLAFGTGAHATTQGCICLLETLADQGRLVSPILDIGAGTGILSLAAHLLGAKKVLAFDIDPDCGPAIAELIQLNQSILRDPKPYESFIGTLEDSAVRGPYGGILANLLLETIQELLPRMQQLAAPGAWLIASGILANQAEEALLSLALEGFWPVQMLHGEEWVTLLCERRP